MHSSPAAPSALSSAPEQPKPQSRRASQPGPGERPHKTARNERPSLQPVPYRPGRASKRISTNFDAASPHDVHHFYNIVRAQEPSEVLTPEFKVPELDMQMT